MAGWGERKKVALHTSSHLTPIEPWRKAVSTTLEGRRVSSEVRLENCTQVWGWAKFGQHVTPGWGKIVLHTCSDLSKPVRTCLNLSTIQWPCRPTLVAQSFFALSNALIFQSYVLSRWNCIFHLALSRAFQWFTSYGAVLKQKCRSL